jgi:hypothetical protein
MGMVAGCQEKQATPPPPTVAHHEHRPPHGGTAIELGSEEYHLELVRDGSLGRLTAYIMDGELENFIRIGAESWTVTATVPGKGNPESLVFRAVANSATGEKVGDTSQFEATSDWIKAHEAFDGVLQAIEIRSKGYRDVKFSFPKGNE